jgi:hypothetical protein
LGEAVGACVVDVGDDLVLQPPESAEAASAELAVFLGNGKRSFAPSPSSVLGDVLAWLLLTYEEEKFRYCL